MSQRAPFAQGTVIGPEQFSTLLDSVQELIAIISPDGIIQFANASFTRVLGHPTEDLAGTSITDLLHANDAGGVRERLRDLSVSGRGTIGGRCRLQSKDGSWRWFDAAARDYTNVAAMEGIVVNFRDVTDLHRMEAERQVISEIVHALNQTANLDELLRGIHPKSMWRLYRKKWAAAALRLFSARAPRC